MPIWVPGSLGPWSPGPLNIVSRVLRDGSDDRSIMIDRILIRWRNPFKQG